MPGFTTHYLFGIDAYRRIDDPKIRWNLAHNHSAYALGLQGPDLFFYFFPSYLLHRENLGALAHSRDTGLFFSNLLKSRMLFHGKPHSLGVADAYISGFLGHYTLDCTAHPYVYAFTKYDPDAPRKVTHYFGQHAYFETEIDNELLLYKKGLRPTQFHQNDTIRLNPLQKKVIAKMLTYAYRNTYPRLIVSDFLMRRAFRWMRTVTRLLNDPSGQKKVLVRFMEKLILRRPLFSPMLASDHYRFVKDPLNMTHRRWVHPWTKKASTESFRDLYRKAGRLYDKRLKLYYHMVAHGFSEELQQQVVHAYGNRSFLSGEELEK
jgi:hypothetical protein